MDKQNRLRICLAASAGGHLTQLLKIADSWKGYETFCITTTEVGQGKAKMVGKVYAVGECNRHYPLRVIKVFLRCVKVILHERPDVVISTGAAPACVSCILGKLIGARLIWIDSIANVKKISFSGSIVRRMADLFLVQWPELGARYKNVEHRGALV